MNKFFLNASPNPYADSLDQSVSKFSSPVFTYPSCETPLLGDRWEDLNVAPFSTSLGPNVRPPSVVKFKDNGAGSTGSYLYGFDETKEQEVFFSVQLPHAWKEGSDLRPHVHFTTPTQTATTITWGLEYTWQNIGSGAYGNTSILTNAVACPIAYTHTIGSLGTISGVGKKISSILICRLFRATGGYVGDALLLSVDFHIQLDTIGSTNETSK